MEEEERKEAWARTYKSTWLCFGFLTKIIVG